LSDAELPSASGRSVRPEGSTDRTATSVALSVPSTVAFRVVPSWKVTVTEDAPSTTCAAVTMWPLPSTTKPVPVAVVSCCCGAPNGELPCAGLVTPREVMSTTPPAVPAYSALALRPVGLGLSEAAAVVGACVIVVVDVRSPAPVSRRMPAPALPPSAAVSASSSASPRRLGPNAVGRRDRGSTGGSSSPPGGVLGG
jgi:hypothetical protein